jgi:hypothetical protein
MDQGNADFMGVSRVFRNSVYLAVSRNGNHRSNVWAYRIPASRDLAFGKPKAGSSAPRLSDQPQSPWNTDQPLARVMTAEIVRDRPQARIKRPSLLAAHDQNNCFKGFGTPERRASIMPALERGRRRTRQDQISLGLKNTREIADLKIRTERRKLVSSAGPIFGKERTLSKRDPAV